MDCWENFEYFHMKPKGTETKATTPLPVRLFKARVNKLSSSIDMNNEKIICKTKGKLINDIHALPQNSVVVLDSKEYLAIAEEENFWNAINLQAIEFLKSHIAPVMRVQSGVDFKGLRFELDVIDLASAYIVNDLEKFEMLKEGVLETISELPLAVNVVAKEKEFIEKVTSRNFWVNFTDDDLDEIITRLSPLMKYRRQDRAIEINTDLADLLAVKEYIETIKSI